jgi:hypothetical protein
MIFSGLNGLIFLIFNGLAGVLIASFKTTTRTDTLFALAAILADFTIKPPSVDFCLTA